MTPLSSALEGELRKVSEYRAKLHRTIRMNWTKWNEWMKEWMNAWNEWRVTEERISDVFFYSTLESLSNSVFERRTSTGSGLFASLGSGLVQTLGQIVFIREKKLSNTNLLESRNIKEEKVRPGNPLYPLIHNRVVPISTRSGSSSRPMATRTERFSNFVSVKY